MLTFSPVFDLAFLNEVLKLQLSIEEIGKNESAGLEKICFAPMRGVGNEPVVGECVVQSIFGYFGNSAEKLNSNRTDKDFTINYLNTLDKCFT